MALRRSGVRSPSAPPFKLDFRRIRHVASQVTAVVATVWHIALARVGLGMSLSGRERTGSLRVDIAEQTFSCPFLDWEHCLAKAGAAQFSRQDRR